MTQAQVYLYAPRWDWSGLRRKRVRAISIQRVDRHEGGYSLVETLYEGVVPCEATAPDVCYVIEGKFAAEFAA